jgi:hypothetical protein
MKRSVAVPLWDLFLIASFLLPIAAIAAFASDREHFGFGYLAGWIGLFLVAWTIGRLQGVSLRNYLQSL